MYDIKFLESIENLKNFVPNKLGWKLNTSKAQEISSCLLQGRLFFQAANDSPIEIKPLQLYYGIMAFARAIILVRTKENLKSLKPSHGVSAVDLSNGLIGSAAMVNSAGTFTSFNDVICDLDSINYYIQTKKVIEKFPFSSSAHLIGKRISIKEILSRLPGLEDLYFRTFNEFPKSKGVYIFIHDDKDDVRIDIHDQFRIINSREDLIGLVNDLRKSYPFLQKWCLTLATISWDKTLLHFKNLEKAKINDLSEHFLIESKGAHFEANQLTLDSMSKFNMMESLQPLTGTLLKTHQYACEHIENEYISEFSLYYLAAFILSSVARYQPNIWMSAITHSVVANKPSSDAVLAMIEKYMDMAIAQIPSMVISVFEIK